MMPPLHLASASPRRRDILTTLGLQFTSAGEDLDERRLAGETAAAMVQRLALAKAQAAAASRPAVAVLGADTAVVLGDKLFGKPESADDAMAMLLDLSGKTHEVLTGVALLAGGGTRVLLSRSEVRFRPIGRAQARAYWHTGEPRDKAGGYAIQGRGGVFVEELRGSYSGVVGLPVRETAELLLLAGIDVLTT